MGSKPFVPGYVEREDTTDSEVENAPETIELSQKEEKKFDKATLIKSINDAASKKIKDKPKIRKLSHPRLKIRKLKLHKLKIRKLPSVNLLFQDMLRERILPTLK